MSRALYADAEWMRPEGTPGATVTVDAGPDADRIAGAMLLDLAARAAGEVRGAGQVQVLGSGFVAGAIMALTGATAPAGGARPTAVVDTTGDAARIREALERLDDLGTLVLAGELTPDTIEVDLYPDVHVRGLRIVGVALDGGAGPFDVPATARAYGESVPPVRVTSSGSLPPAAWYRLSD